MVNTFQVLVELQLSGVCAKWGRVTREMLAVYANELKIRARSNMIVRRVLQRLVCECHVDVDHTKFLRWIATDLAYKDPTLFFMQSERALYEYAQPIAHAWARRNCYGANGGQNSA